MNLNGMGVSRETQERLKLFSELFKKWARSINLVAPSTLDDLWTRHIADSAQIFQLSPGPHNWLDVGSGGGFPGVITAIFLAEHRDGWVHLVESNQKKAAFLRVALAETAARGSVHAIRVETAQESLPACDRVSARAFAELDLLFTYVAPWMERESTKAFLHKGRDYQRELAKARGSWDFDLLEHRSVVEPDSVILEVSQLRRHVV